MKQIAIGVAIFTLLALIITGIWYGSRVPAFTINSVTVTGGETIPHQEVEQVVRQQLVGTYLRLVPRAFTFTYPHESILTALTNIERIKEVTVERTSATELSVTFTEYVAEALWCEDMTDNCVFLDESGYAFATTPQLDGGAFIRFGTPGRSPEVGVEITALNNYETAKQLSVMLDQKGWYVERIDIDAAADAYFILTEGSELKVSLLEPAERTIENLETVLASEKFAELVPGNFKYIDLRFGNKVFVNDTEEELPTEGIAALGDIISESGTTTADMTAPAAAAVMASTTVE